MRERPVLYPGLKPVRVPIRRHRVPIRLLQIRVVPVMFYTRPLQP